MGRPGRSKLSRRQRATLDSIKGLGAAPFILLYGYRSFQPFMSEGGVIAGAAWFVLLCLYYVTARSALDLVSDLIDLIGGHYLRNERTHVPVSQGGQNDVPHGFLAIESVPQQYSSLQLATVGWGDFEILMGWVACFGMLFALFYSPYLNVSGHPLAHPASVNEVSWTILELSSLLTYYSLYSVACRWKMGVVPLIQRCFGIRDIGSGQNKISWWVNEVSRRVFGSNSDSLPPPRR